MPDAPAAKFRKASSISSSSENSDEDLNSDVNASIAIPPSKSGTMSNTLTTTTKAGERPVKRKHSDEEKKKKKKSKHSSFRSASITDNRKLKRIKTQEENQTTTADSQSPSIEPRSTAHTILPPKTQTSNLILPPLSGATKPKTGIALPRTSFTTSAVPPPVSRQILAMDPNLTAMDLRKEAKKLKKIQDSEREQEKDKAAVSSRPSSSKLLSSEDQLKEAKEEKKKKRRRKEQVANGVQGMAGAIEANLSPRSTPILPPKYAMKR